MENEKYPYQKQWEEYKFRLVSFWVIFVSYIPFMLLFGFIANRILPSGLSKNGLVYFIAFVGFTIIWSISVVRLNYWKCPRCGKSFHQTFWQHNIFSKSCLHCKLKKYDGSNFEKNYN